MLVKNQNIRNFAESKNTLTISLEYMPYGPDCLSVNNNHMTKSKLTGAKLAEETTFSDISNNTVT